MGRRSSYDSKRTPELTRWMYRSGLSEQQIRAELGISERTMRRWKRAHVKFREALRDGKELIDCRVEDGLLRRALGYTYTQIQEDTVTARGRKVKRTRRLKVHVGGDIAAQKYWLENRQPKKWGEGREDPSAGLAKAAFLEALKESAKGAWDDWDPSSEKETRALTDGDPMDG